MSRSRASALKTPALRLIPTETLPPSRPCHPCRSCILARASTAHHADALGWYDPRAANPLKSFKHLHARAEAIDTTPAWVESFQERRGVIFAKLFNIGEELPNGKTKQWVCSRADGEPVAMAVIFNAWETVAGPLRAFAMVTTASCPPLSEKDERMLALLCDDEEVATWLGETGATAAELKALLRPYDGSLVVREQEPSKKDAPPPKPKKPKPATGIVLTRQSETMDRLPMPRARKHAKANNSAGTTNPPIIASCRLSPARA